MKRFEQTIERIDRMLAGMTNRIDVIRSCCDQGNLRACYTQLLRLEENAERLTLMTRALPICTGARSAPEDVEQIMQDTIPVELGFTEGGWFCLRMPMLLPKKEAGSVNYLRGFLYPALQEFFSKKPPVRYENCVIIFRHVYARDYPERLKRDHDNIEVNLVTNAVALYTMPDDAPAYCSHFYCSGVDECERTEVYVVPRAEFPQWLSQQGGIPDGGVKLYENRPNPTEKDM